MKKNHQKLSFFLFVAFLLTVVFVPMEKSEGASLKDLINGIFNAKNKGKISEDSAKSGLQDAINTVSNFLPNVIAQPLQQAGNFITQLQNFSQIQKPEDAIQALTNISPQAGNALNQVYTGVTGVVNQFQTSQPSTQPSTPTTPSWAAFQQLSNQSMTTPTTKKPTTTNQPSTPTTPSWAAFQQLSNQSMTTPTTKRPTTTTKKADNKVSRYFCDQTTGQCKYSVYTDLSTYSKPPYYRTISECQSNCKKSSYVCYKYSPGSSCQGDKCQPYASDTPCQSTCTPGGAPLTGTAQQTQTGGSSGQTCRYYDCRGNTCSLRELNQSVCPADRCKTNADCGGTSSGGSTSSGGGTKYSCNTNTGQCYENSGGGYSSLSSCQSACHKGYSEGWSCDANAKKCHETRNGAFTSYESCMAYCNRGGSTSPTPSSGGGTSIPSSSSQSQQTQQTSSGGSCQRQEGRCSTVDNCLKCPSGYYKQSGGCGGCPGKGYDCYILCCPRK